MSRKIVEVEAKTHRQDRVLGDAPALGRVNRVTGSVKGEESMNVPSSDEDEEAQPGDWLLKLGMFSALLIALILGVGLIYFTLAKKLSPGVMVHGDTNRPAQEIPVADKLSNESLIDEQDALDLVRRGLAVRFASKVTDHFLYTETLEPPEVVEFLKSLAETDGLVDRMEWLDPLEKDGKIIARVRVRSQAGGSEHTRIAYLLSDSKGEWKIDFESFVSQVEPAWDRASGGEVPEIGF